MKRDTLACCAHLIRGTLIHVQFLEAGWHNLHVLVLIVGTVGWYSRRHTAASPHDVPNRNLWKYATEHMTYLFATFPVIVNFLHSAYGILLFHMARY